VGREEEVEPAVLDWSLDDDGNIDEGSWRHDHMYCCDDHHDDACHLEPRITDMAENDCIRNLVVPRLRSRDKKAEGS